MENSFLQKPALAMDLEDFVTALNAERLVNPEIEQALLEKGVFGAVTPTVARKLKSSAFSSVGTLTLDGLVDIFKDLKRAGLPRYATIQVYMTHAVQSIRNSSVA